MRIVYILAISAVMGLLPVPGAHAVQQAKSRYSTIDLAKCRSLARSAARPAWSCEGLPGFPIYVALGDARTFLSIGKDAERRHAARQTLDSVNSLFEGKSQRTAVEWRFVIRDKRPVPYATIVRYFTKRDGRRGEIVVVTRVTDSEACQVARIDALANRDAMVIARRIADQVSRQFDCSRDKVLEGAQVRDGM